MKNVFLTMMAVLFFSLIFNGQSQVIFDKEETIEYLIEYNSNDNSFKKHIFSRLANSYNTSESNIEFTFSFKQKRQILKRGNNLDFKVYLTDINLNGDILYKDFIIGDPLIPGKVSFTLKWFKGKQLLNTYAFTDVTVSGDNVNLVNMTFEDSLNAPNYRITMSNVIYNYTIQNKKDFDIQADLIERYYTENIRARNRLRFLTNLNIDRDYLISIENLNDLYIYRDSANSAILYVRNVKQKDFYKKLPIKDIDPKQIKSKLNNINNLANELKTTCNQILDNLDQVYFERGIEMLSIRKPDRAEYFFNKSLEFNHNYAPSHFQLAGIYYKKGLVDRAVDKVFEIRGMNPDQETKMQTVEMARGIYNDFLLDAGELNNLGDYDAAVSVLLRAKDICTNFPEVQCRSNMDIEMSRAVNGKYNMILKDIDLKMQNNNLIDAEIFIKEALIFAQQNRSFIPDNNEVARRISDLYFIYIKRGNNLSNKGSYKNAIIEFDEASRICNSYSEIYCSDELNQAYHTARTGIYRGYLYDAEQSFRSGNNKNAEILMENAKSYRNKYKLEQNLIEDKLFLDIKQAVYTDYIDSGKSLNESGNYRGALEKYEHATGIESNYSVRKNSSLTSYINTSAKSLIFSVIDDGNGKVSVNNLLDARSLYNEAKDLTNKYNLDNVASVKSALGELKGRIFRQECINAQNEYDEIYNGAIRFISEKKYISAHNKISEALSFADLNAQCEIETGEARNKQDYIAPAYDYMQKVNITNDYIKKHNYKSAIVEYQNAESFYNSKRVNSFGLSHKTLFDFIRSGYTDFVIYSIGFYNHNTEFDKAVELIKELSRRNVRSKLTKDVQTVLGTDLATHDFSKNSTGNYKSNIAQYSGGDKFFKYFSKAYKKQWKRLD